MKKLLFGAAAAAAAAWFLKDRDTSGTLGDLQSKAKGYAQKAKEQAGGGGRAPAEERLNDPALARKVESEVFRDDELPKGKISVNVEYGVVYLRGEVPSQEVKDELAERTRKVDGVRAVENLTHLPGEDAPAKDEVRHGAGLG